MADRPSIPRATLDDHNLRALLEEFETIYERESGARMSSEEFYEHYCAGEFDHTLGMAWATYWEVWLRRRGASREETLRRVLPPVAVG